MGTKNSCSIVSVAVKLSFLANLFKDLLRTNKNSKLRNIKMFSLKLTVGAAMLVVLASAGKFPQSSANLMRRLEAGPQRRRMGETAFRPEEAGDRRRMMATFNEANAAGDRRRMQETGPDQDQDTDAFDSERQAGYRRRLEEDCFSETEIAGDRR